MIFILSVQTFDTDKGCPLRFPAKDRCLNTGMTVILNKEIPTTVSFCTDISKGVWMAEFVFEGKKEIMSL